MIRLHIYYSIKVFFLEQNTWIAFGREINRQMTY